MSLLKEANTISSSMSKLISDKLRRVALLISIYFPPEPGGGSTAAWNRAMILRKVGFSVFVLCSFPSYPSGKVLDPKYRRKFFYIEQLENLTLIRLRLLPLVTAGYFNRFVLFANFLLLSLFFVSKILKTTGKISLVYSIAPIIFSSFIGYVYSRLNKCLFIYEVSDLWPEELVEFKSHLSFVIFSIGRIVAKFSYVLPHIIVTISHLAAEHVIKTYKPKATVHVLPIGVEPSKFPKKTKECARIELIRNNLISDTVKNKFIVLYAGLISKATKVDNLVHVANNLQQQDSEIVFLIVGDGEEKKKLEKLTSKYKIKNLFLLPFQPRDMIPTFISASDLCVVSLPSTAIFGVDVPTKFYEYLACYKPQIGICGGELAKIINSNNLGFTVMDGEIDRLADGIMSLKNSPSLVSSMQKNSISVLQSFSLDSLASAFGIMLKNKNEKNKAN
jgi:colanic acid biosynthesis glycosyl transferase WcaI